MRTDIRGIQAVDDTESDESSVVELSSERVLGLTHLAVNSYHGRKLFALAPVSVRSGGNPTRIDVEIVLRGISGMGPGQLDGLLPRQLRWTFGGSSSS